MIKVFFFGTPQIQRLPAAIPQHLTPKAMALFAYLAVTRRPHGRDLLADLLWSEVTNEQARNNLRYLLPELRQALADYLLITPGNISFNPQQPYWLDVEQLRTTLTAPAERVTAQELQAALQLYQGEFLAGFTARKAPVFEAWMRHEREQLHTLVIQGAYRLAERYWQQSDCANALATTQRLLSWEPWHEAGHRLQMQLLAATGQRGAALAQYTLCRQLLADELGVAPEAATTALYEQIRGAGEGKERGGQEDRKTRRQEDRKTRRQEDRKTRRHEDRKTGRHEDTKRGRKAHALPPPLLVSPSPSLPVSPASVLPHNLPRPTTAFIGRESEVAALCAKVLAPDCRLLTLMGEGGIGKTRLALAVAQAILDFRFQISDSEYTRNPKSKIQNPKFPDGVWFIPLADLTADNNLLDQVATVVAKTIGLSFSGQQPLLTQLLAQIRDKALFLLFDNAEQLLPTVADFLFQLLQQSRRSTVLVTSRHVLNLQAETVWRMVGLSVPPTTAPATLPLVALTKYSSVALFVERANRTGQRFLLTAENGPDIAALCRLVEGLPLAVELAAALTRQYTCAELYAALQRDYTILATTATDLAPQHRSIQTMLDYSWRLLSPAEARTLAACAIFAGTFTRTAVLTITGAKPLLLLSLVDQSLLQVNEGRFTMHGLVRQYAAAQFARFPECQVQIAAKHAAYYIDLLSGFEEELVITFDAQQQIQNEIENIRAAWQWSVEQRNLALLAQGLESLYYFYRLTGLYREAIQLLEIAQNAVRDVMATAPDANQPPVLLARLLCHTAEFYRRIDKVEQCERSATEALAIAQQLADPALQGLAYHILARLAYTRSNYKTMRLLAEAGRQAAQAAALPHLLAECLNDLGIAVSVNDGPLNALPHYQQALTVLQGAPNHILEAFICVNLGFFSLAACQYQAAVAYLQQGLALQYRLQDRGGRLPPLVHAGNLQMALGAYAAAQAHYKEALSLIQTSGGPYWESWLHTSYGRWQQLTGDPGAARVTCSYARQLAQQNGIPLQEQWALVYLGHALVALGDDEAAEQSYRQAITLHKADNWLYRTTEAHAGLAALLLAQNRIAEAVPQVEAALALLAQHGLAAAAEPFTVYWTAVRVFMATADPRAAATLRMAYQALQRIASTLQDAPLRRSFLEAVAVNRQLIAAAQSQGVIE